MEEAEGRQRQMRAIATSRAVQAAAFIALLTAAGFAAAQSTIDADSIVIRLEQVQAEARSSVRPYSVTREYKLIKDNKDESQVTAEVNFVPPHRKDYQIRTSLGSNQGSKVVKKILDHESEMTERWTETAITRDNYDFVALRQEVLRGRNCYVLHLTPRRESKELISGLAWVDASTFRIMKVSGSPSRSPSWWIKRLVITLEYGDVEGMWLQRSTIAQAEVRVVGRRTLTSRDLSYRTGDVVAANSGSRRSRSATALASSVN
jgi:hypothetical protein